MNIEELKLILDMLGQLGAQGKEAFVWWVVLDKIPSLLIWIFVLATVCFMSNKLYKACLESTQAHQDLRHIAIMLGVCTADKYRFQWLPALEKAILNLRDKNK